MNKIKIAILLATHNGEKFLEKQLNSLKHFSNIIDVYASDDSSEDNTIKILERNDVKKVYKNSFKSFTKNFSFLIDNINEGYDYYAFCDQDDIWEKEKFNRALIFLNKGYNLYCSTTKIINENDEIIDHSVKWKKKLSFKNSLFQSIAGGNTMVFDKEILTLLKTKKNIEFISHDWWVYIISTFANKKVFFDHTSNVYYRQHSNNQIGSSKSFFGKFKRYFKALNGFYIYCNNLHQKNIENMKYLGTDENKKVFDYFIKLRSEKNPLMRIYLVYKAGFYRQTFFGTIALYSLALFNRL